VIQGAKNWFLNSGIQNLDKNSKAYGSFNAWYDERSKKYSFAFSEITGYGISTLLYLNNLRSDRLLIDRARLAADWLLLTTWDSKYGGFQCRYDRSTHVFNKRVCSFDAGTCLAGLVNLYRETKEAKYLEGAIQVGNWLVQRMQRKDGSFYARILTDSGTLVDDPEKWSSQSGSYHTKISIGLLNLFELTKDPIYKGSAIRVCDWSLKHQKSSGRFVTNRKSGDTHLHPHCYSAEGLLCAGVLLGNKRYVESAGKALLWVAHHLTPTGGVPRMYRDGHFSRHESVDILSQTMRLWLLGSRIYKNIEEDSAIRKMATRLCDFQSCSDDPRSRGGFFYGYTDDNSLVNHVSSWGTMFALQALIMYLTQSADACNLLYLI
jgi:uncharacterized protein YyaL (SSP411 family)